MDAEKVHIALHKIEPGLKKYISIMSKIKETDVSKNSVFQKEYNGFYRMRQRKPEFYFDYFQFMEQCKNQDLTFHEVLTHFYDKFGRIEASFSSKLLASINPNMPVWDEFVLQNLQLKRPTQYEKNRLDKTINLYNQICQWYSQFLDTDEANHMILLFDTMYPECNLSKVKKIDLILWQMR